MRNIIFRLFFFVTAFLGFQSLYAQHSLGVDAPNVISLDENFRIIYTATGKVKDFTPPEINDFDILAGPTSSTMSSTQIINGKRTHTYEVSYTYILQAKSEGTFTIGPAKANIEGEVCSSKPVTIEVVKAQQGAGSGSGSDGSSSSTQRIGDRDVMLRLDLNKIRAVKGEPVIATLKFYTKVNISGIEDVRLPVFNGFWSQEIDTPTNLEFTRENFGGEIYNSALIRKYMLIPQQTGELKIEPAELVCSVQMRSSSSSRSIFDDFFDNYQTVRKRVFTQPLSLKVSPLPSGAPASFTGGVGDFKLTASLSKSTVPAHEAASLVVTVSGTGNINLIEAPSINLPPDFESYDVKRSEKFNYGANGATGTKTFEFPFIPRSQGDFTINPVEFCYYDIAKGKYVTLKSDSLPITVEKGSDTDAIVIQGGVNKQTVKSIGEDIRFISTDSSSLKRENTIFVASPLFYILLGVIVLLFFIFSILYKRTVKLKNDLVRTKNRKAKKMAIKRLKKSQLLLKQNLYSAFYEELHKAIMGYLSDKLGLNIADLQRDRIAETLLSKGLPQETLDELFALLDACEFARYAPSAGFEAMENHYKSAINVISQIES